MPDYGLGEIDPDLTSGTELAAMLSAWGDRVDCTHLMLAGRPTGMRNGSLWIDASDTTHWKLNMSVGAIDILLMTIIPGSGTISLAGGVGVPPTRKVLPAGSLVGGGTLDQDLWLSLRNDHDIGTVPVNSYYGTDNIGADTRFYPLPTYTSGFAGGQNATKTYLDTYPCNFDGVTTSTAEYDVVVPNNVVGLLITAYGGGDPASTTGYGGSLLGRLDVTPGQTVHFTVGGVGQPTVIAYGAVCAGGAGGATGAVYNPPGWNFDAVAPMMMPPNAWGAPGRPGGIIMEFISP